MRIITASENANCPSPIVIGYRGENKAATVQFDYSSWVETYGAGVISLFVKRKGDTAAYPVVLTASDNVAEWLVTATDTNVAGFGTAEFVYTVNEQIAKSAVFSIYVNADIGQPTSEAPDPYESWVETLEALGVETQANAQAAADSATAAETAQGKAEDAQEAAEAAQDAAERAQTAAETAQGIADADALKAEGYAVGKQNGEAVASGSPYYNNNAAYYAEVAGQRAAQAGYAWFDVDNETGLAVVTVTDNLVDAVSFSVNDDTGNLEVTIE